MAVLIADLCIPCGACEPVCPNEAISEGPDAYVVDFHLSTECVGFYDVPRFVVVCPVDAVICDPDDEETNEELKAKYLRLLLIALRQAAETEGSENVPPLAIAVGSTQSRKRKTSYSLSSPEIDTRGMWNRQEAARY